MIRVKVVTGQLVTSHPTDGMDKVAAVKVLEPILVRIVGVGPTVEVGGRRVFYPVLIMSVLRSCQLT